MVKNKSDADLGDQIWIKKKYLLFKKYMFSISFPGNEGLRNILEKARVGAIHYFEVIFLLVSTQNLLLSPLFCFSHLCLLMK